ncbi:Cuticle protein 14 isoform b, partial [Stegodyphus mimosarum]
MKIWVLLALLFSCQAAVILTPRNPDDVGAAVTFNNQDGIGSYDFGYSEGHPSGSSFRRETGDAAGNKIGSFGLRDADGRLRIVRYVADANGFRADVTSNEPGVAPQDPASATINKPAVVLPAAPVAPVALPPPPPPQPAPIPVQPVKALPPPPPPQYNYIYSAPAPVAVAPPPVAAPPPPPPAYYRPVAPVAAAPVALAPVAAAPVGIAPVSKSFAAYGPPPPPPPPPAYYTNLVQGKGYVNAVRNYASLLPPFAAVPPQFGYVRAKPLAAFQALGYPL